MWKWLTSSVNNLSSGLSLWAALFGAGGILAGGAVSAWAASATAWLAAYGPIAYVAAGLAGGLLFGAILIAYRKFRIAVAEAALSQKRTEPPRTVNPLDPVFEKKRITL